MEGWSKIKIACKYAGVCERSMRDWFKLGLKHSRLPSGAVFIKFSDIDEFLQQYSVNQNKADEIVRQITRGV